MRPASTRCRSKPASGARVIAERHFRDGTPRTAGCCSSVVAIFMRSGSIVDRLVVQGTPEVVLDPVRYNPRNGGGSCCRVSVGRSPLRPR